MNKVLVIDDDKELCALIKRSVLTENIEADCCNSGKEGLEKLKEKDYQLVVLDVMMPGMDGFETLEQIRKESNLPILMFTSKIDSVSKVRGLRAGADDYLRIPFDMDELIARILSLVRRYTRFNQSGGLPQQLDFDGLKGEAKEKEADFVLYVYSQKTDGMQFFKYIGVDFQDLYHVAELQIEKLYDLDKYLGKLKKKDFEVVT